MPPLFFFLETRKRESFRNPRASRLIDTGRIWGRIWGANLNHKHTPDQTPYYIVYRGLLAKFRVPFFKKVFLRSVTCRFLCLIFKVLLSHGAASFAPDSFCTPSGHHRSRTNRPITWIWIHRVCGGRCAEEPLMWRFHARCTLACTRACVRALLRCPLLLILFVCPRGTPGVDRTAYHHMSLVSQSLRRTLRRKQRFPSFFALLPRGQKHDKSSLHTHPIDRTTVCAA